MRLEVATLAGGCFWCLEAVFNDLQGVESVVSGYSGGHVPHPTYEQVCDDTTGHAEVVQVTFEVFYPAEDYHQRYFERNPNQPYCRMVVAPKVAKFRKRYLSRLKKVGGPAGS